MNASSDGSGRLSNELQRHLLGHCSLRVIRLICHMTGSGCMVAEDHVLLYRSAVLHRGEEVLQVTAPTVHGWGGLEYLDVIHRRQLSNHRIILGMPLLFIGTPHCRGETSVVVAWLEIDAELRRPGESRANLDHSMGTHKAGDRGSLSIKRDAQGNYHVAVFKEDQVQVGDLAAILIADQTARGHGTIRNRRETKRALHCAEEMNHWIAGNA